MSGWAVGDLALCVRSGKPELISVGQVLTVTSVLVSNVDPYKGGEGLTFREAVPRARKRGFLASCFIKVTPEDADAFDQEVIDLYLGKPITQEQANAEYFERLEAKLRRQMQGDD